MREHVRVVQRGDLSDHPTDANPTEMGGPGTEHPTSAAASATRVFNMRPPQPTIGTLFNAGPSKARTCHTVPSPYQPLGPHATASDGQTTVK